MSPSGSTASTISTGGGGNVFEQHVIASFIGLLLTGAFLPIFPQATSSRVHLQAKRLGWHTDDIVIEGIDPSGRMHKVAAQAKRTFILSESNKECCEAIASAWNDFNNAGLFDPASDALALVVHLGTNRLLGDFGWLLTQARASTSVDDFAQRLGGVGLLNKRSKNDYGTVKAILTKASSSISDVDLWRFLRVFYVLSYDLTNDGSKDESTIKTLLERLATTPGTSAAHTWNELIALSGQSAYKGRSLNRDDLPPPLLLHYRHLDASEHSALVTLREHSQVLLNRTADHGRNGLSFPRAAIFDTLMEATSSSQAVLVIGPAGTGKSVLAKRLVRSISSHQFVVAFAAEEFHAPHIDTVLSRAQVGVNWITLQSLMAMRASITILVEGMERLLEADERGALTDLLHTVAQNPSIRLLITCRDYHAETVERAMLSPSGIPFGRVLVDELTDEELNDAVSAFPDLAQPLASASLRRLLRNPFMLMRAAELSWPAGRQLPLTEKALRERFWGEVVRRDDYPKDGLPTRRAATLTQIALKRARSLRPYVEVADFDPSAVHALATDGLISFDSASELRAAPAHDVFEDWALTEWLSAEFERCDGDNYHFARSRDLHPALRRAYRRWLQELIESNAARGSEYVAAVTTASELAAHLRDDTLVAVFQSTFAATFLEKFAAALLQEDADLLRRAIHIVRVASKTVMTLEGEKNEAAGIWHVPAGSAWPNLLAFLSEHWDSIPSSAHALILGLVEDWSRGIFWETPYPDGAVSAGRLIERLLPVASEGWRKNSEKQRVIELIILAPKVVGSLFKSLVDRRVSAGLERRDSEAEMFYDTLMKPFNSSAASRDYPNEIVSLCMAVWLPAPSGRPSDFYSGLRQIESVFGIGDHQHLTFFPPSALQGPFKTLLRFHPTIGVEFIVALVNRAVANYGERQAPLEHVEPPWEIGLVLADGTGRDVWADGRLWNAYRATSVMPGLIECALMALEAWLLEASAHDRLFPAAETWMLRILENSNNVALVAVVASVCMAHPVRCPKPALLLLKCRPLFDFDQKRWLAESGALAPGGLRPEQRHLQSERAASNRLPHRRSDLEGLARALQVTSARDAVWSILDEHRAALPPPELQSDDDLLWRLALSRMDLRMYEPTAVTEEGHVSMEMRSPESDIQALIARHQPERARFDTRTSQFLWATHQFERDANTADAANEWRARLEEAKKNHDLDDLEPADAFPMGGSGIVAAVCIRDHWSELDASDQAWCEALVLKYVGRPPAGVDASAFTSTNPANGVAACAYVVPQIRFLRGPTLTTPFIEAILHFNEEARHQAIKGVSDYVLPNDEGLAAFCSWALVTYAAAWNEIEELERGINFEERSPFLAKHFSSLQRVLDVANDAWYDSWPSFAGVSVRSWADRQLARQLIRLFRDHPRCDSGREFFGQFAMAIQTWWARDHHNEYQRERDFDLEVDTEDAMASFLLHCDPQNAKSILSPLLGAVDRMPGKVAELVQLLLAQEDHLTVPSSFWDIWQVLTGAAMKATWLRTLDREHSDGRSLIRVLFLNTRWKEGIRTWSRLASREADVDGFFRDLPPSAVVLESYVHYLYHIGSASLPHALGLIADKFGDTLSTAIQEDGNIRWYLDGLVSRMMYENLPQLRASARLRQSMMLTLDALVDAGSSVAFQLRDDFVTPAPSAH